MLVFSVVIWSGKSDELISSSTITGMIMVEVILESESWDERRQCWEKSSEDSRSPRGAELCRKRGVWNRSWIGSFSLLQHAHGIPIYCYFIYFL